MSQEQENHSSLEAQGNREPIETENNLYNEDEKSSSDHESAETKNETSIIRCPFFPVAFCSLILALALCIVILASGSSLKGRPTHLYLAEHRQLYDDWTSLPFVEVRIELG